MPERVLDNNKIVNNFIFITRRHLPNLTVLGARPGRKDVDFARKIINDKELVIIGVCWRQVSLQLLNGGFVLHFIIY